MPNDPCVVCDFGIAAKQLIASAVDENPGAQGKKQRNGGCNAQRGLDGEKKRERVHVILRGGEKLGFESAEVFLVAFWRLITDSPTSIATC
jgi:hypothetical protein